MENTEIIRTIRSYKLDFPHRIWVVTEPWSKARVEGPDELIVVRLEDDLVDSVWPEEVEQLR